MTYRTWQRLAAEAVGTALLVATVVGSGIMAETLSGGNTGVALLANTVATAAMLFVLITVFGPVSGAHFNPAVSLTCWRAGELPLVLLAADAFGGAAKCIDMTVKYSLTREQFGQPIGDEVEGGGDGVGEFVPECDLKTGPREDDGPRAANKSGSDDGDLGHDALSHCDGDPQIGRAHV